METETYQEEFEIMIKAGQFWQRVKHGNPSVTTTIGRVVMIAETDFITETSLRYFPNPQEPNWTSEYLRDDFLNEFKLLTKQEVIKWKLKHD